MENLADIGIFFGGLGLLLLSFAVFWAVSEWRSKARPLGGPWRACIWTRQTQRRTIPDSGRS